MKIQSLGDIRDCFENTHADSGVVIHRLMHYIPDTHNHSTATLVPASVEISTRMLNRLDKKLDHERTKLMLWLDGAGQTGTFCRWLFENYVHEVMLKGGTFPMKSLDGQKDTNLSIDIDGTVGVYERFKEKFTIDQIFRDIYSIPKSKNQAAIDSCILFGDCVCLFQITRNATHPVGAEGILALLDQLGCLEAAKMRLLL
mmetsp:Transcript_33056/g.54586  ORF Transcript_33056/g.54586 Transcript_33056/m.54586 type:complete len:200 (+) Transcript_33056:472-1071(+)